MNLLKAYEAALRKAGLSNQGISQAARMLVDLISDWRDKDMQQIASDREADRYARKKLEERIAKLESTALKLQDEDA